MPEIWFTTQGHKDCIGSFNAMDRTIKQRVIFVLNHAAIGLASEAQSRALWGVIKDSIRPRNIQDGLIVKVMSSNSLWVYLEYGMGPLGEATGGEKPAWLKHKPLRRARSFYLSKSFMHWFTDSSKFADRDDDLKSQAGEFGPVNINRMLFKAALGIEKRGGMKAYPFIRPTIDANFPRIIEEMRQAIYGGVEDAFRGIEGEVLFA